jgi:hypothetical protein
MFQAFSPMIVPIFADMQTSEFVFHLTGSQFFGNARVDSDYDFLVQDSLQVREFLQDLGFKKLSNNDYNDSSIVAVFRYYQGSARSVDVQCVKNVELKLKAQDLIRECYGSDLPKDRLERCRLWNLAVRAAQFAVTPA